MRLKVFVWSEYAAEITDEVRGVLVGLSQAIIQHQSHIAQVII